MVEVVFRDVQKKYFSHDLSNTFGSSDAAGDVVTGVAALCSAIIGDRSFLKSQVTDWLAKTQGGSIQTVGLRRALLATYNDRIGRTTRYLCHIGPLLTAAR